VLRCIAASIAARCAGVGGAAEAGAARPHPAIVKAAASKMPRPGFGITRPCREPADQSNSGIKFFSLEKVSSIINFYRDNSVTKSALFWRDFVKLEIFTSLVESY
jgi:hypothetical protein